MPARFPDMAAINDYRDLEVWQIGRQLAKAIYEATTVFPPSEKFGLVPQLRRAAVSIPSNIAEGWGRRYTAEYVQFVRKASGSRTEAETQLILSADLGFLEKSQLDGLLEQTASIGRMLVSLERSLLRRSADAGKTALE